MNRRYRIPISGGNPRRGGHGHRPQQDPFRAYGPPRRAGDERRSQESPSAFYGSPGGYYRTHFHGRLDEDGWLDDSFSDILDVSSLGSDSYSDGSSDSWAPGFSGGPERARREGHGPAPYMDPHRDARHHQGVPGRDYPPDAYDYNPGHRQRPDPFGPPGRERPPGREGTPGRGRPHGHRQQGHPMDFPPTSYPGRDVRQRHGHGQAGGIRDGRHEGREGRGERGERGGRGGHGGHGGHGGFGRHRG